MKTLMGPLFQDLQIGIMFINPLLVIFGAQPYMFGLVFRPIFQGICPQFIWPKLWYQYQYLHQLDPGDLPLIKLLVISAQHFSHLRLCGIPIASSGYVKIAIEHSHRNS